MSSRNLPNKVELAGVILQVRGAVNEEFVGAYARKIVQGDPGPDDHPFNSTFIQRDWEGGGQILIGNPSTDYQRFWWSTCGTEWPQAIILPPLTREYTGPAGETASPVILGDFPLGSIYRLYLAWQGKLYRWNQATDDFTLTGNLQSQAVNEGTVYRPVSGTYAGQALLAIPESGTYDLLTQAENLVAGSGGAVDFLVWDNKLYRLTLAGTVDFSLDGLTWTAIAELRDGSIPRHLVRGWDRDRSPAIYVITSSGPHALDPDTGQLLKLDVDAPPHPRQGRAAAQFEGLVWSVGMGLHRIAGEVVISDQGLDRGHGLPPEFRGRIVSLAPSYGKLFALVEGEQLATSGEQATLLAGTPEPWTVPEQQSYSALMVWNQRGWHYRWHGTGAAPANVVVSIAENTYRVWWGAGGKALAQDLPVTFFNPRDPDLSGPFAGSCEFYSFFHHWNWIDIPKVLKEITCKTRNTSASETVEVAFQFDEPENPWQIAGTIAAPGKTFFRLNPDSEGRPRGLVHDQVRLRLTLRRGDDPGVTPVVEWYSLVGRKWTRPARAWQFVADLTAGTNDFPPEDAWSRLQEARQQKLAVPFTLGQETVMVDIAGLRKVQAPGPEARFFASIYLVEAFTEE